VDFTIPEESRDLLGAIDGFIEREIKPLERGR
jgi:hypothetical protein